ncbi:MULTISPECIES: hypothetical protein [Bacillus]|uniref:hypothetical protein n=1 Tax=Bacillus TaxID=1386 RepID=UPI000BB7D75F|nr:MULTISPECIES: hypothetical protein [Bacillus]
MTKNNKKLRTFLLLLIILSIFFTIFYFRPLSAQEVFPEMDNIEKIDFLSRFHSQKEPDRLTVQLTGEEMEYFKSLLEMPKYRRSLGKTNIHTWENAYDIVIFHKSSNYSIVINDKGYVVVEGRYNKTKYKIISSKDHTLLSLFDELIFPK